MRFKTAISTTKNNKHHIRGHALQDLVDKHSFVDVIFLLLRGDFPKTKERELLNAALVASVEHGISAPSVYVSRISASVGNDMHTALAAGILATGRRHGGAVEQAALIFAMEKKASDIVSSFISDKKRISGFGHKIYMTEDPRARALYAKTISLGFSSVIFEKAYAIEKELEKAKNKKFPLNIDGALAATLLTLGFSPKAGTAFFLIPRMVGMSAHVLEEYSQANSYYRLDENDIEFEK